MKYFRLIKKILIYGSVAVVVLIIGLVLNTSNVKNKYADYTSYNTDENGVKALYLLAGEMGYNTGRFKRPVRFMPNGYTQVIIRPDWFEYVDEQEKKYLKEWTERGNALVYADEQYDINDEFLKAFDIDQQDILDQFDGWIVYKVGRGKVYLNLSSYDFTNNGLKGISPGVSFINVLDIAENKNVLFNEYYHGMGTVGVTIWDIIGPSGILILIQIILGLILLMFVLSKRFGRPVTVFETIKRKENENIYALSNIYAKAKADDLVLETILVNFERELSKYLGLEGKSEKNELITAALGNKYLYEMDLQGLLDRCERHIRSGGGNIKELVYLVQWIEKIRRGIK